MGFGLWVLHGASYSHLCLWVRRGRCGAAASNLGPVWRSDCFLPVRNTKCSTLPELTCTPNTGRKKQNPKYRFEYSTHVRYVYVYVYNVCRCVCMCLCKHHASTCTCISKYVQMHMRVCISIYLYIYMYLYLHILDMHTD